MPLTILDGTSDAGDSVFNGDDNNCNADDQLILWVRVGRQRGVAKHCNDVDADDTGAVDEALQMTTRTPL